MDSTKPRIITPTGVLTVADIERRGAAMTRRLREQGFRAGDRVGLSGANSPDLVIALLTLMHLDASIMLLDDQLTDQARNSALTKASATWLLCDDAASARPVEPVRTFGLRELTAEDDAAPESALHIDLASWSARQDALIVWSSGTTGSPTGVVRSGGSVLANIHRSQRRMGYTADDVLLPLLPFSHQYGLSLVLLWWFADACLIVVPPTRLDRALEAVEGLNVTVVDGAPSTYHSILRMLERKPVAPGALASVRMWCVGGAPLGITLATEFRDVIGAPLLDGYGSSEAGNIALAGVDDPTLLGKPLDGIEIDILGEDGTSLPPGEVGELLVRTPDFMTALLADDGTLRHVDRSAYRTGDVGYLDERGNVAVLGRKGAVHRHGHTLYPEALARKAEACGAPVEVVPFEDTRRGCQLVFAVADDSRRDPRMWRRLFNDRLAVHERPNKVVVVPAFPRNRNGKVDMNQLRTTVEKASDNTAASNSPVALAREDGTDTGVPLADRAPALRAVENYLRTHREEILAILTEVSNHKTAEGELDTAIETLSGAFEEVSTYRPPRIGSTAVFMPSNIPLYSYVLYLLVPALYSERVVFRPSSHINKQLIRLHELLEPHHGLPLQLSASTQRDFVEGPVTEADLVIFTGTYANAEKIRSKLGDEQLFVYFGQGINPFIVGENADVDRAVTDAVEIRLLNSGQDCFGPDVLFVHESVSERFLELLTKRLDDLVFGTNADPHADYGPMHYEQAFGFALDHLHRHAGDIVHGGHAELATRELQPTVLLRDIGGKPNCEELFAPIFNVLRYSTQDELHGFLASPFFEERAMGAMVYGDLPETVELLQKRHEVCVNTTLLHTDNGNAPFGGRGMVANYVAHRGKRSAEPLLASKAVADYLAPAE
ncbi:MULTISPECIES: aldehyde dehydrogenase family protein [Prauserella salsuginis group]|uniref:Aldehyde dehydrogenase family protein n=1 Tax=Prauserella salsuginis TaxID=387889 RepID=A0ABW6G7L0_9PSEU|nr:MULTISPECIES: aldehyde dehydrogenase family protein [Prauserella salsuginis group]MCR3719518.1 Acyl-CoA synthetase (AMP-forming)/AMP-acid ligase II [Prauserella flava]MCR3735468.1 Acyl-CoA synthetase (AMP-forming)/AMP-acid ligase II [Prauserella salsuginis]